MGFTKEFAPDKTNVAFPYKREGYKPDLLPVKKEKRPRTNGSNINKDTIVIMSNVTVSFLCLLAPPWC